MAYDNTNRGALFKNKKQSENGPGYTGTLNVEGTVFRLSAWVKTAKSGEKYFSLAVTLAEDRSGMEKGGGGGKPLADDLDDSIPFIRWE